VREAVELRSYLSQLRHNQFFVAAPSIGCGVPEIRLVQTKPCVPNKGIVSVTRPTQPHGGSGGGFESRFGLMVH
jgi:hypothetical protein